MKKHVEMQTIKGKLMQKYVVLQVTFIPICGLGAKAGCGRLKRTFSLQRRKPQIGIFWCASRQVDN